MSLRLQRLAYTSDATRPDLALESLVDILAVSDRNNRREDLTGALLISRGRFFQVLEGPAQSLDRALGRIGDDPRHRDIRILWRGDVPDRRFAQWAMVAARISPSRQAEIHAVIDDAGRQPLRAIDAAHDLVLNQISGRA